MPRGRGDGAARSDELSLCLALWPRRPQGQTGLAHVEGWEVLRELARRQETREYMPIMSIWSCPKGKMASGRWPMCGFTLPPECEGPNPRYIIQATRESVTGQ